MSYVLAYGTNKILPNYVGTITVSFDQDSGADTNLTAFLINGNGRAIGDHGVVFFNQTRAPNGAMELFELKMDRGHKKYILEFDLSKLTSETIKVVISLSEDSGLNLSIIKNLTILIQINEHIFRLEPRLLMNEKTISFLELITANQQWALRPLWNGLGFGLAELCRQFGIDVEGDSNEVAGVSPADGNGHEFQSGAQALAAGEIDYETISDEIVRREFKKDFVDNIGFGNNLPSYIVDEMQKVIQRVYDDSGPEDKAQLKRPIIAIFDGIRTIYTAVWIYESNYAEPLARKMKQLTFIDEYGDMDTKNWDSETVRFATDRAAILNKFLHERIPVKYSKFAEKLRLTYMLHLNASDPMYYHKEVIINAAEAVAQAVWPYYLHLCDNEQSNFLDDIVDPYEYEECIADEFNALGWECRLTSGSGDQGADVIAEKQGLRLIIQCKLYSSPVGNKAVQEVAAAKAFYKGNRAVVISNNDFTTSAKQLADSLGVKLIHHSQIEKLHFELFGIEY